MAIRFFTLAAFFTLLYGALGFNLYRLQIEKSGYYVSRVEARIEAHDALTLRRGQITFTNRGGVSMAVAINKDYPVIYAVPKEIEDVEEAISALHTTLALPKDFLQKVFKNRESMFKIIVEKATEPQVDAIKALAMKGVEVSMKQYRYYPYGRLGAQIIGFIGINDTHDIPVGLYGLERKENNVLARGEDVHLTIDHEIQSRAEETLERLMKTYDGSGGTVIVQETQTGKIVALANAPGFDPNVYENFPVRSFENPAVQLVYEPGSVFKPLTIAAGIDTGVLTPSSTFVDTGSVTLNGKTIRNWDKKAHGKITMTNVIERSVNTGVVFAEQKIGHEKFVTYLKKFGFGESTNIELPGEVIGSIKNLSRKEVRVVDFATAAFGQGTAVTPLQMITAFSALGNGGLLMRPFIYEGTTPYMVRRVIEEDTSRKVMVMMESAVQKAHVASIPQYRIAGKTGTAFIPDFVHGGYSDEFVHTYIGFVPASRPQYTILVKLDKPKLAELAGVTVVPAFRELAQFIINYVAIPPDALTEINL